MHRVHAELDDTVRSTLAQMAEFARTALLDATRALLTPNVHVAQAVISRHTMFCPMLDTIDERIMTLSARPSRTGLDTAARAARISADIERMAELAVGIAKTARLRYQEPAIPVDLHGALRDQCHAAADSAFRLAQSLRNQNPGPGPGLTARIDHGAMDRAHRHLLAKLLAPELKHPITTAIDVLLVAGYYKHFADHGDRREYQGPERRESSRLAVESSTALPGLVTQVAGLGEPAGR